MAGLPRSVIQRAQEILAELEGAVQRLPIGSSKQVIEVRQLPLFQSTDPLLEELREIDIMSMSPLEAINKLSELHKKAQ